MRHLQRSDATQNVTGLVLAGVVVLALTGLASVPFLDLGPLSLQMLQHLAVMNIVAPVLALGLPSAQAMRRGSLLAPATYRRNGSPPSPSVCRAALSTADVPVV